MLIAPKYAPLAASEKATSTPKNRVRGFCDEASGQASGRAASAYESAPGYSVCSYELASGRPFWLNRDPIGEDGGINLYGYVLNNPINRIDPLGLEAGEPGEETDPEEGRSELEILRDYFFGPPPEPLRIHLSDSSIADILGERPPKPPEPTPEAEPKPEPPPQQPSSNCPPKYGPYRDSYRFYPNKVDKTEDHHIWPIYLGGDPDGPTVPLNGEYHQNITNEFRANWGYGQGAPSPEQAQSIMRDVYAKYPLPPH